MSALSDADIAGVTSYLFEVGTLKRTRRSGWWIAGVRDPESIAEHSHRTAVLAAILAAMEGADPARACLLAALHDTQETRVGDIPHIGRRYLTAASNETVTADQVRDCPPTVAAAIQNAVADHEAGISPEARVAHDADKLECLLQAVEYRRAGNQNVQDWIDSSRAALKTTSAVQIAEAALTMTGLEWRNA
jgi:putative hydrolase of HD superfamily